MHRQSITMVRGSIGKILTTFFFMLYIAGSIHLEWCHSIIHEHTVIVSHSYEQEKDPCHRSIYHGDAEQGCDHQSHVVWSDECQLCDIASSADKIFVIQTNVPNVHFKPGDFVHFKQSTDSYWAVILSSRAPPVNA